MRIQIQLETRHGVCDKDVYAVANCHRSTESHGGSKA